MGERLLVALGGNALMTAGAFTAAGQAAAIRETAEHVAALRAQGASVVLTHGNGPQVGLRLRQGELARGVVPEPPLDELDADTQGDLGYLLQQALGNALARRGLDPRVATVVTQVVVDGADPAFQRPTKPVGQAYPAEEARALAAELGWSLAPGAEPGTLRRVVASPRPQRIVEGWAIALLLASGAVAIGCGGGGVPVLETPEGLRGVAAVIDKDHVSALLAREVGVERVLFTTGVPVLYSAWGRPEQRALPRLTCAEARALLAAGEFPPGSMGPKVEAAIGFVEGGGREALITSPLLMSSALKHEAGTVIVS